MKTIVWWLKWDFKH